MAGVQTCIGYISPDLASRCEEQVTSEVRVAKGDVWHSWRAVCAQHGDSVVRIMGESDGWSAERRELKGRKK